MKQAAFLAHEQLVHWHCGTVHADTNLWTAHRESVRPVPSQSIHPSLFVLRMCRANLQPFCYITMLCILQNIFK